MRTEISAFWQGLGKRDLSSVSSVAKAYTSFVKGKPDIFIKHLKEERGTIIAEKGLNITPVWVPGQFLLSATLSFSGDPEIYLLTGTGKIIKRLTKSWGIDVSPTWSPDGKKMAFVSNRSGSPQIYMMTVDTGQVERFGGSHGARELSELRLRLPHLAGLDGHDRVLILQHVVHAPDKHVGRAGPAEGQNDDSQEKVARGHHSPASVRSLSRTEAEPERSVFRTSRRSEANLSSQR